MAPETIEEYVHWVLAEDPTLKEVDPEVVKQLEADYVQGLETEITAALVAEVSSEQIPVLEKMLEHDPMSQIQEWIEHNVPNASDVVAGALLRFRANYMTGNDVL